MTTRLKLMLAALAVIAALLVLDRPAELGVVEVSEQVPRAPSASSASSAAADVAVAAPVIGLDAPIPDLFAGSSGEAAPPEAPQQLAESAQPAPRERPPKPFKLLGFKQEGQVREAYLLRGDDVATVRSGDLLDRRYRVLALGADTVDIKDKVSGTNFRIGFEDHQ